MKNRVTWLFCLIVFISIGLSAMPAAPATTYEIEVAHNDEFFIINGEKYEAMVYCLGWEVGDRVIFIEGSPYGACAMATLYNVDRNEKCQVWCE